MVHALTRTPPIIRPMNINLEELQNVDVEQEVENENRTCYCDQVEDERIVYPCSGVCGRSFHISCVNVDKIGVDWKCNKCDFNTSISTPQLPWDSLTRGNKMLRLGVPCLGGSLQNQNRRINIKLDKLRECIPTDATYTLHRAMNHDPLPYPDTGVLSPDSSFLHAKCGRAFDMSMLCFEVLRCDCCGTV